MTVKALRDVYCCADDHWKKYLEESRSTFLRKWESIPKCPATLKDYDMVRTLGTGTFGRVVLVKRKAASDDHRYFALKVLDKQHVIRLKQVEHVLNEKKVLFCIDHPFTVKLDAFFKVSASFTSQVAVLSTSTPMETS